MLLKIIPIILYIKGMGLIIFHQGDHKNNIGDHFIQTTKIINHSDFLSRNAETVQDFVVDVKAKCIILRNLIRQSLIINPLLSVLLAVK